MSRQIVFDLETTGFKFSEGHRIVEIGAIELINGAITGRNYHTYINPKRDMPIEAQRVHGLSAEFLADKPVFEDDVAAPAFLDFIQDAELIAHNGLGFDLPFLNDELGAAGLGRLKNQLTDTLLLARKKFPGAPASLDALCSRFSIDTAERERDGHGALLDSRLLATVYIELTGGVQAGLQFSDDNKGSAQSATSTQKRGPARQRPSKLKSRLTEDEQAAHSSFLSDLGETSLWSRVEN